LNPIYRKESFFIWASVPKGYTSSEFGIKVLEGVVHAFCVPGESYLPLKDSIYETESIQLISTCHEGDAAFMAEAYGKATCKRMLLWRRGRRAVPI
jgi:hypothetical protein